MIISKHAILEILQTAPYRPGEYVSPGVRTSFAHTLADAPQATFCVVGSILRAYLPTDTTLAMTYAACERATQGVGCSFAPRALAKRGNYLGALSAQFENITTLTDNMVTQDVREELKAFVLLTFPDFIDIKVDVKGVAA